MSTQNSPKNHAQTQNAENELLRVHIDDVLPDPSNERNALRNIDELATSIGVVGLVEPIVTVKHGDQFKVVSGHRRLEACKRAGLKNLNIVVRDADIDTSRLENLVCNIQREDLNPIDLYDAVVTLYAKGDNYGPQKAFAQVIGKRQSWVSEVLGIGRLDPSLREEIRKSELRVSCDAVTRIAREKGKEKQTSLVKDLLCGATNPQIRTQLSSRRAKKIRISAKVGDFVATVTGPEVPEGYEKMLEANEALAAKVRTAQTNKNT
ncbi:MAG: ParB/RepB/Spo0J family partition protein [Candidatus Hydrogenedentes bacterium]|nr:ParB/RepB/Spo0J family partition protein [Candidatus Hydrogenedentota bacterium]